MLYNYNYIIIVELYVSLFDYVVAGVFALLNAYAVLVYIRSFMTKSQFKSLFVFAVIIAASLVFLGVVLLTYAGKYLAACPSNCVYGNRAVLCR